MESPCVFCEIAAGLAPAHVVHEWPDAVAFVPRNPVTVEGHILVIPRCHVQDAFEDPVVYGMVSARAAELGALEFPSANLITSIGQPATQTVFHLHVHLALRTEGDGLPLLWTPQQEREREQAS